MVLTPTSSRQGAARADIVASALALVTETFPTSSGQATVSPASGSALCGLVGLRRGDVITNVVVYTAVAGTAVTAYKVGVYSKTGARLGISADIKASLAANSFLIGALAAPLTVSADDGYYLVAWGTATTAMPTLIRGNNIANNGDAIGSGVRRQATVAGLADLDATIALADLDATPWLACS